MYMKFTTQYNTVIHRAVREIVVFVLYVLHESHIERPGLRSSENRSRRNGCKMTSKYTRGKKRKIPYVAKSIQRVVFLTTVAVKN